MLNVLIKIIKGKVVFCQNEFWIRNDVHWEVDVLVRFLKVTF